MTPEQTVNLEIFDVLQHIKEESLVPEKNGSFFYDTTRTVIAAGSPNPTQERKWSVVRKFAREKALKIIKEIEPSWTGGRNGFYLKIIQPKFDQVYNHYQTLTGKDDESLETIDIPERKSSYAESNISNIPVKIVIADLKSKYQEIEQEKNNVQFFIKIAQYGKYILENQSTIITLSPLYNESKDGAKPYLNAWKKFIDVWKIYAKDLLERAEEAGIKNDPNPLSNEIASIESRLNNKETYLWESDLENYYIPYQRLIWKFNEINRTDLLIPKHEDAEKNIVIYPIYNKGRDEWDRFKYSREASVWWAHYQICRLAAGVLGLEISKDYFKKNRIIDGFYKFEFDEVARGNINRSPIVLHHDKFATWIKRLHEYLIPRLENIPEHTVNDRPIQEDATKIDSNNNKEKVKWSNKFHWLKETEFYLDENISITFGSKSSDRINIFNMLVEAKGDWVKVSDMAKKIGKSHSTVRTVILQINEEKLKKDGILLIVSKSDFSEPGAYRLKLLK